ncbi:MAG: gene transfer agent family protein [Hyphomicrobiaceae bacterium]
MANKHRGEIDAVLDGTPHRLCLTLGALAELEAAFGEGDMLALASRFSSGRLAAADCVRIIGAGLRGAGHDVNDAKVAAMQVDGGAAGFVEIVARLLTATFGGPASVAAEVGSALVSELARQPSATVDQAEGGAKGIPFPGTR